MYWLFGGELFLLSFFVVAAVGFIAGGFCDFGLVVLVGFP